MILKKALFGAVAMSLVATPIVASAGEVVGAVTAAHGNSFVSRDGRLLRATPAMRLYSGDRVLTQSGSSAKVALAGGCSVAVGASSMANVSSCSDAKVSDLTRADYQGATSSLHGRSSGFIVGLLAFAAAITGLVFALRHTTRANSP